MTFKLIFIFCVTLGISSAQIDSAGIKLIEQKKYSEAQLFFETAIKKNDKNADSYYYLAGALSWQNKLDDAQDAIEEAIDLNENVAKYHLLRGGILGRKILTANIISQGFLATKIKNAFFRASELDPSNVEARQALFNYYLMAPGIMGGSDEKAFEQANAVLILKPSHGYLMLANYYIRVKNDLVEGEKQIKNAITAEPEKGDAYNQLGYFYLNQKRFNEASTQMKKYTEVEPKNPNAYDSYGDVFKAQKKYDQAIEKYLYALSIDKNFAVSLFSLAECYEFQGLKEKAKETFQWFLKVEPQGRRAESAKKKINEL